LLDGATLRAGQAGEAAAVARVAEARSALRPAVGFGVNAGVGLGTTGSVSPTVRVSQRIYDSQAARFRVAAAETRAELAASSTVQRLTDRALLAVSAWEDLNTARVLRQIASASASRNDALAARIERRLSAGAGRTADTLRAETRQADARATLASAEGRVAQAAARAEEVFGFLPEVGPLPSAPLPEFDGRANEALQAANLQLAAARADLQVRKAERAPTVFLDLIGGLDEDDDPKLGASLRLDYALGTGGQRVAAVEAAEAEVSRLSAEVALIESDLDRALVSAGARLSALKNELAAARAAETAARQALHDAERGFESGRVDTLDLLDLGRELDLAATRRAEIEAAYRLAGYERLAIAGELLSVLGVVPEGADP
jgi:outer membrane protein TolC